MSRTKALLLTMTLAMSAAVAVMAHPMTYKGTVVSVADSGLQVHAMDDMTKKESTMTFRVNAKTKVFRGKTAVTFAAAKIQKGERIAVTINMDVNADLALEIKLAAAK